VRSLTLTDCDTHDNWPPEAFKPFLAVAAGGGLRGTLDAMLADKSVYRSTQALGPAYEHPEQLSDDSIETYLRPFVKNHQRTHDLERFLAAFDNKHTLAIEPQLKTLKAPTLIVTVQILRKPKRGDGAVSVIDQAGKRLKISVWMLSPDSSGIKISERVHISKKALLSLTSLLSPHAREDRGHDNLLPTAVDGCKGGHRGAIGTIGAGGPNGHPHPRGKGREDRDVMLSPVDCRYRGSSSEPIPHATSQWRRAS
jgi:hypothetical protein